jgi:hypothetical protein
MYCPLVPPLHGFFNCYGEKMAPNATIFLPAISMFIIVRSRTSPMQIGGFYIHVIFHPNKPLNFIIFLQRKGENIHFFWNFNPIYSP